MSKDSILIHYTIEQLSNPETYKADKDLYGLARTIAMEAYQDRNQWLVYRDEIINGMHPRVMFDYRNKILAQYAEAFEKRNEAIAIAKSTALPDGVTLTVMEDNDVIHLGAPWDGYDLAKRVKRLGGRWDRDKKVWVIPVEGALSLKRIFANWQKSQNEKAQAEASAKAERQRKSAEQQRQRKAQWAAERDADMKAREAQKVAQAKAIAERVQIKACEYKIGDMLNGKRITGFGKSWVEGDLSKGQLYQQCEYGRCENEPVCANCFQCAKHCGCGTQTTYCYAYFS